MVSTLSPCGFLFFLLFLLFCTLEYVRPWWVKFWKGLFFVVTDPLYNLCRGHHLRHKELYHLSWWFYALLLVFFWFVCLGFLHFLFFFCWCCFLLSFYHFFAFFVDFNHFFFCIFCFYLFFFREMVFSKVIDEITLSCCSFVLSQSSAKDQRKDKDMYTR